jgi:hypothetical protein
VRTDLISFRERLEDFSEPDRDFFRRGDSSLELESSSELDEGCGDGSGMDAEPDVALGGGAVDARWCVKRPDAREGTDLGTGGLRIYGNCDGSGRFVCRVDADTTNECRPSRERE